MIYILLGFQYESRFAARLKGTGEPFESEEELPGALVLVVFEVALKDVAEFLVLCGDLINGFHQIDL